MAGHSSPDVTLNIYTHYNEEERFAETAANNQSFQRSTLQRCATETLKNVAPRCKKGYTQNAINEGIKSPEVVVSQRLRDALS